MDNEELPGWIDAHSVNCIECGALVDERECVTGPDGEGDVCYKCQKKHRHDDKGTWGDWQCDEDKIAKGLR